MEDKVNVNLLVIANMVMSIQDYVQVMIILNVVFLKQHKKKHTLIMENWEYVKIQIIVMVK